MIKIKFLEILNDKLGLCTGEIFLKRHYANIIFTNNFWCWEFLILLYVYVEFENKTYPMAVTILKKHTFCIKGIEFGILVKPTSVKNQAC